MMKGKRGASESGGAVIILVLVLAVAGIVLWFTYGAFQKGSDFLPGEDAVVQAALQSCRAQLSVNPVSWCTNVREVKYGRTTQYVTCENLNSRTGNSIEVSPSVKDLNECKKDGAQGQDSIARKYCGELGRTNKESFSVLINAMTCERKRGESFVTFNGKAINDDGSEKSEADLKTTCTPSDGSAFVTNPGCDCVNSAGILESCAADEYCTAGTGCSANKLQ